MVQIVILDDRETNRKIFSKLAASIEPGVTVRSFGDPPELLAWLEQNTPDLIVTDFKMPSMDGAEFIRRFRAQPNSGEIPVIVITVYEEREFRLRALLVDRDDDHRNLAAIGLRAKPADEFRAVHRRHLEVGDDQIGCVVTEPGGQF